MKRRFLSLGLSVLLLLIFPFGAVATDEKVQLTDIAEVLLRETGLTLSTNAQVAVEYGRNPDNGKRQSYLTITEAIDATTIKKTVVVPYEEVEGTLQVMDANLYVAQLEKSVKTENGSDQIMGGVVYIPDKNIKFGDLTLYLNCYYQYEYPPKGGFAYRFTSLYAVATSGTSSVQNFKFTAQLGGIKCALNPYQEVSAGIVQYTDVLSVSNMAIGSQYSKNCVSISPYYINTGSGNGIGGGYCQILWSGTYNGKPFDSAWGFPAN